MLTRLKVSGFKNLVDVDVRFGPFTCIAGANGVGKSNLLDAIAFLGSLADRLLIDAAMSVRNEGNQTEDIRGIFHRIAESQANVMSFEAEMIIPKHGVDDLGQPAIATKSFLRYRLDLGCRIGDNRRPLEILHEELAPIKGEDVDKQLGFDVEKAWINTVIISEKRIPYYISTAADDNGSRVINIHHEGNGDSKPRSLIAANLPRTAISDARSAENPTATLVRREMQAWRRLQLEPSALRKPDPLTAPAMLGADGAHLPATLYNLARNAHLNGNGKDGVRVYATVANRLAELIDDVRQVEVERDEKRELLTLRVGGRDGTLHRAGALSDGTLRFLALTVLELDPDFQGVLCLEEPENGIQPARISAMLDLLEDIATDVHEVVGPDNPLRQVIVSTHSPAVVAQVPEDSLLVAETARVQDGQRTFDKVIFSCLPKTWRTKSLGTQVVPKGKLLSYLAPVSLKPNENSINSTGTKAPRRVIDDPELQSIIFGDPE